MTTQQVIDKVENTLDYLFDLIISHLPENYIIDLDACDCISTTNPNYWMGGVKNGFILLYHMENSAEILVKPRTLSIDDLTWILIVINNK